MPWFYRLYYHHAIGEYIQCSVGRLKYTWIISELSTLKRIVPRNNYVYLIFQQCNSPLTSVIMKQVLSSLKVSYRAPVIIGDKREHNAYNSKWNNKISRNTISERSEVPIFDKFHFILRKRRTICWQELYPCISKKLGLMYELPFHPFSFHVQPSSQSMTWNSWFSIKT